MHNNSKLSHSSNKRIVRNTLFTYGRSVFSLFISLFTTRIVLEVLGVDNYGVFDVVGGIVGMLTVVTASLQGSTSRFFTYALGAGNINQLNKIFNTSMIIFLLMGIIVIILGETVGLWFLYNKMNIPDNSMNAAAWVYQLSIMSFVISLTAIPYGAIMTAYEKFDILAYLGVFDLLMRLGIVYLLLVIPGNKLKIYALLTFGIGIVSTAIYRIYCISKFEESKFKFSLEKTLFKEMFSYSGWSNFGELSAVLKGQGVNILINIFFGAALNAARSIAYSLANGANQFITGFMAATRPQIVKSFAAGDRNRCYKLVNTSAKLSFFLLLIFAMPIFLETEVLLKFWLGKIPEFVVLFARLIIVESLIATWSNPLMMLVQATGKIKWYQIIVGSLLILNLPIGYLVFKLGAPPASVFYVFIVMAIVALIARLIIISKMINFGIFPFLKIVVLPCCVVWATSFIFPLLAKYFLFEHEILRFIIVIITCGISTLASIYLLGLSKDDKEALHKLIMNKIGRKKALEKQEAEQAVEEETEGFDLK